MISNLLFLKPGAAAKAGPSVDVRPAKAPSAGASFTELLQQAGRSPSPQRAAAPAKLDVAESRDKPDKTEPSGREQAAESKPSSPQPADAVEDTAPVDEESVAAVPSEPLSEDVPTVSSDTTAQEPPPPLVLDDGVASTPVVADAEKPAEPVPMQIVTDVAATVNKTESGEAQPPLPAIKPPSQDRLQAQPSGVQGSATPQDPETASAAPPATVASLQAQTQQQQQGDARAEDGGQPSVTTPPPQVKALPDPVTSPSPSASPSAPTAAAPNLTNVASPSIPVGSPAQNLPLPEHDSPTDQANFARVVRGMQGALNQQGGSVTLRMTPPELGTVRIELALMQGVVSARFHAETESVRQLLTEQLAQLRSGLERQGLNVERLTVQTQQPQPTAFGQQQQQGGAEQSPQDGRSRGEYAMNQNRRDGSEHPSQRQERRRERFQRELFTAVG